MIQVELSKNFWSQGCWTCTQLSAGQDLCTAAKVY